MQNDANLVFAFQGKEIGFQSGFRAPQSDVIDTMILQIAEGSGITLLPGEEVLVDAQNLGTKDGVILTDVLLNAPVEVALHGRRPDPLSPAQATSVDTVQ